MTEHVARPALDHKPGVGCEGRLHDVWELTYDNRIPPFFSKRMMACDWVPIHNTGPVRVAHVATPVIALNSRQNDLRNTPGVLKLRRLGD